MTTAACLLLYGLSLSWLAPPFLHRLTRRGLSPHLGVAAWLTAMGGVLIVWVVAIALIVVKSTIGLTGSQAVVVCLEILGIAERALTPGRLGLLLLICAALAVSTVVTVKVSRSILGLRSRSRDHARAARLVGAPTDRPDVLLVTAEQPAAYCVAGRPNAIVVTTAALELLDESQLAAVLAHEDAHISGRHHHLLTVLRALESSLPRLPLFRRGAAAVADLLEMCADDAAARRHGSRALVAGMITLAGPLPGAVGGHAVAATAVVARADRGLSELSTVTESDLAVQTVCATPFGTAWSALQ